VSEEYNVENQSEENNAAIRKTKIRKEIISWVSVLVFAVLAAVFINRVIIVNARVPTSSMRNTINEGTRLVAFRLSYVFSDPERLDVIVFDSPDGSDILYVKRIIGMPGETVEIINGQVFIDGSNEPLYEWYLFEAPRGQSLTHQTFIIPEDSFFVMGDHRNDSKDSRGLGMNPWDNLFIHRDNILGRAAFTYFPRIGIIR